MARVTGLSEGSDGADGTLAAGAASTAWKGRPAAAPIFAVIARAIRKARTELVFRRPPTRDRCYYIKLKPLQHTLRNARLSRAIDINGSPDPGLDPGLDPGPDPGHVCLEPMSHPSTGANKQAQQSWCWIQ